MQLIELRRAVGSPPQTTMRKQVRALTELGALERRRQAEFPGSVDYALSRSGRGLVRVARIVQAWLGDAPEGPLELGTPAAKSSIKALVDGWSSTIVRALAARPLSLTELSRLISSVNYPSLERRIGAMRLAGQIASCASGGRSRPYAATPWLRRAIAPLVAAAGWERRFGAGESGPITRIDVESAFLLALPLLRLPPDLTGAARLVTELRRPQGVSSHAGVLVTVAEGRVVSCVSRLEGHADAWSSGSVGAWLSAVNSGGAEGLETGGDVKMASALIAGLRDALRGLRSDQEPQ